MSLKQTKVLVRVIGLNFFPNTIRALQLTLGFHRIREENILIELIPEKLRFSNQEFIMIWDDKTQKLARIQKLSDRKLRQIKQIIKCHEKSLDYLEEKEKQLINFDYISVTYDFFRNIIGINYNYGLASDRTRLEYFALAFGSSLKESQSEIKSRYNINVSAIIKNPLIDLFQQIAYL